MKQRLDESDADFKKRRAAYDHTRTKGWRTVQKTLDAKGNIKSRVSVRRGRKPADAPPVGNPVASSTLYDREGRVTAQWIKTGQQHQKAAAFCDIVRDELSRALPPRPVIFKLGGGLPRDDLMTIIPIGDPHIGMLSWRPETGASWDLEIAEDIFPRALERLLTATPQSKRGVLLDLGDYQHYDSTEALTPRGKHYLDADSRYQKMVRVGLRVFERMIEIAAMWFEELDVIRLPGNHDPFSATYAQECFALLYRDNPRIRISTDASPFRYLRFGKVMIGTTHGDQCAPDKLGGLMSVDRAEDWGQTAFRYAYLGHVHSRNSGQFPGGAWETFRTMAPGDAWAHRKGYRSQRDMIAITHHREFGEVERHTVNPKMLEQ